MRPQGNDHGDEEGLRDRGQEGALTPSRISSGTTETMAITAATKSGPRIWTTATLMVSPTGLMVSPTGSPAGNSGAVADVA